MLRRLIAWCHGILPIVAVLAAGCAPSRSLRAQDGTVLGPGHSRLDYLYVEPPGDEHYPLVLYLDGSGCRSVTHVIELAVPLKAHGFAVLLPEKRGVQVEDDGSHCSAEYLRTNDRAQRVGDANLALADVRAKLSRWDGRLIVAGASEGGAIAAAVARSQPSVVAVLSFGGGGWSQAHELLHVARDAHERAALEHTFDSIRRSPTDLRSWNGHDLTFRRWASYLDYAPSDDLLMLDVPVYVAQGVRDTAVPVESADAVATGFAQAHKTNLTYRRYAELDHRWSDRRGASQRTRVLQDALRWLVRSVPQHAPTHEPQSAR